MLVVGRGRLFVGDGYREIGDPVPEGYDWPNLRAYLQSGLLVDVPEDGARAEGGSASGQEPPAADPPALVELPDTAAATEPAEPPTLSAPRKSPAPPKRR